SSQLGVALLFEVLDLDLVLDHQLDQLVAGDRSYGHASLDGLSIGIANFEAVLPLLNLHRLNVRLLLRSLDHGDELAEGHRLTMRLVRIHQLPNGEEGDDQ